ncbi:ABC transporter ATP-binding protein [Paenibacillus sp. GCM10012307]|uniref:ABC transporter ATP-binding protein n=1 Tax=Paenibacillus roseus TaxID=2798579 RepID=A0A934J0G6_9BACL|nr:ABC transporter ATP-binding protein [Paenibacillus roseus]MBJ6362581.1 ABC transporter ATP-binding protein [Paenibacillus roseus]
MKLMLGLISPTEGNIYIQNKSIKDNRGNMGIGYLPENIVFPELLTVTETLKNFALTRRVPHSKFIERINTYFQMFGISDSSKALTKNLSKGMRQKVGLIQSLIHDPDILIYDEPTTGLDPISRNNFFNLIKELKERGKTFIISSHNTEEIESICDDVVFFDHSKTIGQISDVSKVTGTDFVVRYDSNNSSLSIEQLSTYKPCIHYMDSKKIIIKNSQNKSMQEIIESLTSLGVMVESIEKQKSKIDDKYIEFLNNTKVGGLNESDN